MAVPVKESIPINFAGGIDQKTDPWQVGPANFLELTNSVFTTGGRLTKRNGFAKFGNSVNAHNPSLTFSNVPATIGSARKVFSYKDELLLNDAFNLYSYDESSNSWFYKGRSTCVDLSTQKIIQNNSTYVNSDSCIDQVNNLRIFAFSGQGGVLPRFSIQDAATGQFIINQQAFGSGTDLYEYPRCISVGGVSYVFFVKFIDHKLYYQKIVNGVVTGAVTPLVTLNALYQFYDIDVDPYFGNIYISYLDNSAPAKVTISAISPAMVIGNTISVTATATNGVSWFCDTLNIWVIYATGTAVSAFVVDNAVSLTVAPSAVIDNTAKALAVTNVTGVWSTSENKAFIFYDPTTYASGLVSTAAINYNTASIVGGVVTPGTSNLMMGSVNLNSKAFAISGIPHVVGLYTYTTLLPNSANPSTKITACIQATNFLLNLYNLTSTMNATGKDVPGNIAAKILPGESATLPPNAFQKVLGNPVGGSLPRTYEGMPNEWYVSLLNNSNFGQSTQAYDPFLSPLGVVDCKFDFNFSNPDVQVLGNNALISVGQMEMYDGAFVCEQNFHIYPNALTAVPHSGGTGVLGLPASTSLYSYIYIYEWIDNQGQLHRSFPSPVVTPLEPTKTYTFTAGTNGYVDLTIPALRVTNKPGTQVVINIYRTTANGSIFYLLGQSFLNTYGTVTNNPWVDTISFTDTAISDDAIQGNIQLYTTGAQGYFAPPASKAVTNYKNRAIYISSENQTSFGYSNAVLPNFPVQFVPYFVQNIGSVGGSIITAANMDDKLIIFKSGATPGPAIWYMTGQGPAPSGNNNDFTDPLPISVDCGCIDRASVVLTPVGLMFKGLKGIYLLDRGLQVSYIGAPVEQYNQYNVVSAQLIPSTTQVRFLLSNGTILMFDYFFQRWGTFSNPAGISDCIFQAKHTFVTALGEVYQEAPGTYVDGSNPVLMSFKTSWIKLAGLQGYQRAYFFYFLANYLSPHQLSLSVSYDFSPNSAQTNIITPDSSTYLENWRIFLAQQRCQSFQVAMQELYTGTPGAALTMTGLNLIAGMKSKFIPMPNAYSAG